MRRSKPSVKPPSFRAVAAELRGEIRMYRDSYAEADGVIRDRTVLRTIAALETALHCVRFFQNRKIRS